MSEPNKQPEYRCPKHKTALCYLLKGGAGYCLQCLLYVQADGVPMPELAPEQQARRQAGAKTKRRGQAGTFQGDKRGHSDSR
jgi:hypothetical protein